MKNIKERMLKRETEFSEWWKEDSRRAVENKMKNNQRKSKTKVWRKIETEVYCKQIFFCVGTGKQVKDKPMKIVWIEHRKTRSLPTITDHNSSVEITMTKDALLCTKNEAPYFVQKVLQQRKRLLGHQAFGWNL